MILSENFAFYFVTTNVKFAQTGLAYFNYFLL